MELFKDHYTIIEAADLLSTGDPARKREIQKNLELIYFRELYDLALTIEPHNGREYPPLSMALKKFTLSRNEVERYSPPVEQTEKPKYLFKKTDKGFFMIFDGEEIELPNKIGYEYLRFLMLHEHDSADGIAATDLEQRVRGLIFHNPNETRHESIDRKTLAEVKKELENLDEMITEAEKNNDSGLGILKSKREELVEYLNGTTYRGKLKTMEDEISKASDRVSKALKEGIEGLSGHEKAFEHFKKAIKPYASNKRYDPPEPLSWKFE